MTRHSLHKLSGRSLSLSLRLLKCIGYVKAAAAIFLLDASIHNWEASPAIMIRFDILTLFPQIFSSFVRESLLAKAIEAGLIQVHTHDIRRWTTDKHNKVDDRPYGGGPGMLLQVQPVVDCVEAVQAMDSTPGELIMMTPQGETLKQSTAQQLSQSQRLLLLCGRYEGFDQRVIDILQPREISLGDFVLNGGEVAAMAIVEATIRLVPGVLGDEQSSQQDSFSDEPLLEFPQYTRPREFRGHVVPEILLSGNHQQIAQWRAEQRQQRTAQRRKDLFT
jgi:tRNA (guanine37-N1)-methyltransferase